MFLLYLDVFSELNEEKAARASHKRELEELNQKKSQEVAALNTNLQQVLHQYIALRDILARFPTK